MSEVTGRVRGRFVRSALVPFAAAMCLLGCGGGAGERGSGTGGGPAQVEGGGSSGAEDPADPYAETRRRLEGRWREHLPDEEARVLELMRMAVEHPDWRRRDIERQGLSTEDATNLESFLNIMRIDPEAEDRLRAAVDNAGMRARFTEDTVHLGRDDMQDVVVPYEIVAVEGDSVEILLEAGEGEPTALSFVDEETFEAPWGGGGRVITFDKQ